MFPGVFFGVKLLKESLAKASTRECMTTRSGREYGSFSSINSMATPNMDDLICLMVTEAESRRGRQISTGWRLQKWCSND